MARETVDAVNAQITGSAAGLVAAMAQGATAVRTGTAAIETSFETMAAAVKVAIAPLLIITAILEGGAMFKEAIAGAAELGDQLEKSAQKTGIAATELSRLQFAAHMADISADDLTSSLNKLSKNLGEAATNAMAPAAQALKAIGVSAVDANGRIRPLQDVTLDIAGKFAKMEDGAGKTAIAMDLFGRSGANLIPLLNQGAGGIAALEHEADKLGITMSERDVAAAAKYEDQMKEFHSVISALGRTIAIVFIPLLTKLAEWAEKGAAAMIRLLTRLRMLKPDLTSALDLDPQLLHALGLDQSTPAPLVGGDDGKFEVTDEMKEKLAAQNDLMREQKRLYDEQTQAAIDGLKEMMKAEAEVSKEWLGFFDAFPSAWNSAVDQWMQGGETMRDFWRDLMRDLVVGALAAEASILKAHASTWLAKRGITIAGVAEEVLVSTWSTIKIVANYAYQAAAAAWAAIAGIPGVGPFLAPAVAAATLAGVLALASGGGGGGGASVGGGSRVSAPSPGSSSTSSAPTHHVTIQAMDAQSFHDFAMRNPTTFAKAMVRGVEQGVRLPNSPGRG